MIKKETDGFKPDKTEYSRGGLLLFFLRGCKFTFAMSIVASFFVILVQSITPQVISYAIDSVIGDKPPRGTAEIIDGALGGAEFLRGRFWIFAAVLGIFALFGLAFRYARFYLNSRANNKMTERMRNSLFRHVQRLPSGWHSAHNTGDIIQRCTSDVDTISNFVANQLNHLVIALITVTLALFFMFSMDITLALIASAFIPLTVCFSLFFYSRAKKHFKQCDEQEGVLSTYAQENLTGVRVVRAFGRERYERDKFEKQNVYYTGLWVRLEKYLAAFWTVNDGLSLVQCALIVILGTVFCVRGNLTEGKLVAFVSYNVMLMGPVRQLGRIISNMSKAGVALGRIAEVMNAREEESDGDGEALSGDIEFRGVSFEYESGKPVLTDINLEIREGQTLGVIGGSGSGKSTLVALLDRLFTPTAGEITIGGRNIEDIPLATLRKNIGLIVQEGYVYSGTIAESVAIAADTDGLDEVRKAATAACVDDNFTAFKEGYQTIVGERGVTLSGGQKQRLAIARTLMRKTPYLVFDDSLSAVDGETDAAVRRNLREQAGGATVIVISHRITTVMHADKIIVLENGRIKECGTHASLVKEGGVYARIYDMQMSLPEDILRENLAAEADDGN